MYCSKRFKNIEISELKIIFEFNMMFIIAEISISLNNARIASCNASSAYIGNKLEVLSVINQHNCLFIDGTTSYKKLHIFCNKKIVD